YGLYNVNKRLLLYYGNDQKPITIDSKYREGPTVTLMIPLSPKTIGGNKHV
ncbi:sensor histidine kinase, partial [Enterococcus faecium]